MNKKMAALIILPVFMIVAAPAVSGDTIYLKNGQKLQAYIIEQTSEKVTFIRYGGKVTLSLDQVEKIVKDDYGKIDEEKEAQMAREASRRTARETARPEQSDMGDLPDVAAVEQAGGQQVPRDDEMPAVDETATREHWQKLKRDLESQIDEKKKLIDRLEKERRGLARNFINTSEIRKEIDIVKKDLAKLESKYRELPAKARKEGVPPGWLR
jgi:DNA repair exonuclease SbcCD ATPase subunit